MHGPIPRILTRTGRPTTGPAGNHSESWEQAERPATPSLLIKIRNASRKPHSSPGTDPGSGGDRHPDFHGVRSNLGSPVAQPMAHERPVWLRYLSRKIVDHHVVIQQWSDTRVLSDLIPCRNS
jgi:hypothetical protein